MKYLVYDELRDEYMTVAAPNAKEARKAACILQGRKPSDKWTGISTFSARKK